MLLYYLVLRARYVKVKQPVSPVYKVYKIKTKVAKVETERLRGTERAESPERFIQRGEAMLRAYSDWLTRLTAERCGDLCYAC